MGLNGNEIFAAMKFSPSPDVKAQVSDYEILVFVEGILDAIGGSGPFNIKSPSRCLANPLTAAEFIGQSAALTIAYYDENMENPAPADLMRGLQDIAATLTQDVARGACAAFHGAVAGCAIEHIESMIFGYDDFPRRFVNTLINDAADLILNEVDKAAKAAKAA